MTQSKNRGGRRKVLETHRDEMMRAALNILSLAAWLCVWFLSVLSCIDDWLPWFWCSRDCLFTFKCGRSVLQVVFQRLSDCAFRCLVSASRAQCTEHLVFSSRLCHWGYSASSLSDFQGLIYSSSPRFCDHSLIRELKGCLLSILALICDPDVSVQTCRWFSSVPCKEKRFTAHLNLSIREASPFCSSGFYWGTVESPGHEAHPEDVESLGGASLGGPGRPSCRYREIRTVTQPRCLSSPLHMMRRICGLQHSTRPCPSPSAVVDGKSSRMGD